MKPFKSSHILPAARDEFKEARTWYASQKVKGLSNRFSKAVKIAISQLLKNPGAYTVRYKNVRIVHVEKFPYAIHFFIKDDSVIITAIIYDRRDPYINMKRV